MTPEEEYRRKVDKFCAAAEARFQEFHNIPPHRFVADAFAVNDFLDSIRMEWRWKANAQAVRESMERMKDDKPWRGQ